jgi:hypothetical protein
MVSPVAWSRIGKLSSPGRAGTSPIAPALPLTADGRADGRADGCALASNCTINNSDDQIAIKSGFNEGGREFGRPSANILVEDCVFGYGDGVAVGSETSGGVHNVTVRRSVFTGLSLRTLRVKTARGRCARAHAHTQLGRYV